MCNYFCDAYKKQVDNDNSVECNLYDENKKTSPIVKEFWSSVFDLGCVKSKRFTGTIVTDGIVVDIHYHRPKKEYHDDTQEKVPKKQEILDPKKYRVLGNDPGRVNIYYMVEETSEGKIEKYKLSRSQYYNESGCSLAIKESNTWNLNINNELKLLSKNSSKGVSLQRFSDY